MLMILSPKKCLISVLINQVKSIYYTNITISLKRIPTSFIKLKNQIERELFAHIYNYVNNIE